MQSEVVLAGGTILVVELLVLTPQDKPRFLASIEYSAEEAKLNNRDPLEHTRASEQTLRFFNEQAESSTIVGLSIESGIDVTDSTSLTSGERERDMLVLEPIPQERPRFLASFTYIF